MSDMTLNKRQMITAIAITLDSFTKDELEIIAGDLFQKAVHRKNIVLSIPVERGDE